MSKKIALITGITGQDGSYLSEHLLDNGYEVWGIIRRHSVSENQTIRIDHIFDKLHLVYGDLTDVSSIVSVITRCQPDEIYNLAAQSHVRVSYEEPLYTAEVTGVGALNVFEATRIAKPNTKIYQASSSEQMGNNIDEDGYQRETTPMHPVSPYGCSKLFAYSVARNYRNAYDMYITNGILFNHESPRRGISFVTNKIARDAVEIYRNKKSKLELGNLESCRDWGHAKDYTKAMHMMMQLPKADDYVCATGVTHSVRNICEIVFEKLGMDYTKYVTVNQRFLRPEELRFLKGDSSKLRQATGWAPTYTFEDIMCEMVDYWLERIT